MVFLVGLFFLVLAQARGWECGGDHSREEEIPRDDRRKVVRSGSLAPIRIKFWYINFDLGSTELNNRFNQTIMPAVESFFKTSINVYPVQGSLSISSRTCIDINPIPDDHRFFGVKAADMIIYMTVNNLTGQNYSAYAGFCERQATGLGNVIAGMTVLNIPNFQSLTIGDSIALLTHEIFHILGFGNYGFQFWRNKEEVRYPENTLTKLITKRGVTKYVMVTPTVQQKAREAFGCNTLEGIELEDYGGSVNPGSHWDRRIMMNDFMTGSATMNPYWSTISLAALQDSGWYTVDYKLAIPPMFGKLAGCGFIDNKCIINGVSSDPKLWCSTQESWTCDIYSLNKAQCMLATYSSNLTTEYQYFPKPTLGGTDAYADFCPFRSGYSNGNCREGTNTIINTNSHEVISPKSRCVSSTLILKPNVLNAPYAACYEVIECLADSAVLKIGSNTVVCPFKGGRVAVPGYDGTIICPASGVLCADVPCISMCYGRGVCKRGICVCFEGFGGDDCSIVCPAGCMTCNSNSCLSCKTGYFLEPPNCNTCSPFCLECSSLSACTKCIEGYFISSGRCVACSFPCSTCTLLTSCSSCHEGYGLKNGECVLICLSLCKTCASNSECLKCNTGYYLSSSRTCEPCVSTCSNCTASFKCQSCISGYELRFDQCVIICPLNCLYCESNTLCNICKTGFNLTPSQTCIKCSSNCKECTSETVCTVCHFGYSLSNKKCDVCSIGFYMSKFKTCISCSPFCSECTSETVCSKCHIGYTLMYESCVVLCSKGCNYCVSDTLCYRCDTGYLLTDGRCDIICDDSNCSECTSATVCTVCKSGYRLKNGGCYIKCPSRCLWCESNTLCNVCKIGFYLTSFRNCTTCDSTCSECTSEKVCTVCKSGYQLSSQRCVLICSSNCLSCTSISVCITCNPGYFLSSNNCVKCDPSCKICSAISTCTECNTMYQLDSGKCKLICSNGCKTCTNINLCTECLIGYKLYQRKCYKR